LKPQRPRTWRDLIEAVIQGLPRDFTLQQVRSYEPKLSKEYPENRNIDAKIRQTLQVLRDQGVITFLGGGRYRKSDKAPTISLHFDPSLAVGYASRSQMARVMLETWAELNLYCLCCKSDRLLKLPDNTPLADFLCPLCDRPYQLKAKDGRFAGVVPGAEFKKMITAVRSGAVPEYVLAEYDTRWSMLVWVRAVPGSKIVEERIIARKPLSDKAQRRGWVGCNINIAGIPSVDIIVPRAEDRTVARAAWATISRR
jgi:hypothetical protein